MSFRVANLDTVKSFDLNLLHFVCDGVLPVARETVDTGSHEKIGTQIVRRAKQFIDVAFPIANVNATHGFPEQRC
jgi:hypothetical protein